MVSDSFELEKMDPETEKNTFANAVTSKLIKV